MAQMYTLDEAARQLGVTPSVLRQRLNSDWKKLRVFRDGANIRFRADEIDELARSLGRGSDPDLQLLDEPAPAPKTPAPTKKKPADDDLLGLDSLELDAPLLSSDSSKKIPKTAPIPGKASKPSEPVLPDDGVFALADDEPPIKKPASPDSDVRLKNKRKDQSEVATEMVDLDADIGSLPKSQSSISKSGSGSANPKTSKLPKTSPIKKDVPPVNSEFELKLGSDSDDFELELDDDSVDLGTLPGGGGSIHRGDSGINLQRPADSGISLEKADDDDDSVDFELNMDATTNPSASGRLARSSKNLVDSDSEFELSLDDEGGLSASSADETSAFQLDEEQRDIFETDFEIPALDDESASEAVALEEADTDLESSDFDLDIDGASEQSESGVVALDEEDVAALKPSKKKKPKKPVVEEEDDVNFDDVDLDRSESASMALRGLSPAVAAIDDEDAAVPVGAGAVAAPTPWGVLPAIALMPTVLVMFVVGLMGWETIRAMWGYQQPSKTPAPVTAFIAKMYLEENSKEYKEIFGD